MMKTKLYKDITTDKIYTFAEVKNEYEVANDCEIEIDNDTMMQIINENVVSVGGNKQWKRKFFKEVLQWGALAFAVALFFVAMFYYWVVYGYAL